MAKKKVVKDFRVPCPFCKELIIEGAKKCRFCGEWQNKKQIKGFFKFFLVLMLIAIGFYLIFKNLGINSNSFNSQIDHKTELRNLLEKRYSLARSESTARDAYRNFLHPNAKTMTEQEYVDGYLSFWKNKHLQYKIHSVIVDGNIGWADVEGAACLDSECSEIAEKWRNFRKFEYIDGKWKDEMTINYCPRSEMYEMEPEFYRALNLILQRTTDAYRSQVEYIEETYYKQLMNCIKVEYSTNETKINNAEAVFRFQPGQSTELMLIIVSPRYKNMDDLVLATLLAHELSHALRYAADLRDGLETDCYEDEALAFTFQNWFVQSLNPEEQKALFSRVKTRSSQELMNVYYIYEGIPQSRGLTYEEKAINFVKSNPYYQQLCKDN